MATLIPENIHNSVYSIFFKDPLCARQVNMSSDRLKGGLSDEAAWIDGVSKWVSEGE